MKRNTVLLTNQVRNKLMGKCTTAIVTEAFINALPFDKDAVSLEATDFVKYASNVIDKMHPETLIDRAMESTINDFNAHIYVSNLKEAVESVVDSATKRIVQESINTDKSTPEILAETKLNVEETEKFIKASKKSGNDAVAKLVKDKMIDVIKDEKDSYESAAKMRNEIKDVIKKEGKDLKASMTDKPEEVLESYFNLVLNPTDPRDHISVFSKMQDICMEALTYSNEVYYEIPYKLMEKITLESTFNYFDLSNRTLSDALESMMVVTESAAMEEEEGESDEEEKEKKKKKIAKTAFICTICIMTLLETLKTMHLAKPEMSDVKNFVDAKTDIKDITRVKLNEIEDKVNNVINDSKKSIAMGSLNAVDLEQAKESLTKVKGILEGFNVSDNNIAKKANIIRSITTALEAIDASTAKSDTTPTDTGYFISRLKDENITSLGHGIKLIAQKPMVREIVIKLASDLKCSENSNVDIEITGTDGSGSTVATYMITIHALPEFGETVAEVIRECANYCDLGPKVLKMYFTDAGYAVPLKA